MSFLDDPKSTLNPEIFTESGKFRKDRLVQILANLYKFVPKECVSHIYLLGSMAGYQYNDRSDIDINVMLVEGADREIYHQLKKKQTPYVLPGTKHEVTYFFNNYYEDSSFKDAAYAVYDLTNNRFIIDPKRITYNPKEKFEREIWLANKVIGTIASKAKTYLADKAALEKLAPNSEAYRSKVKKIEREIDQLVAWYRKVDRDRKDTYRSGWGTPRDMQQNITYKLLEYHQYKQLLTDLEKADEDGIDSIL